MGGKFAQIERGACVFTDQQGDPLQTGRGIGAAGPDVSVSAGTARSRKGLAVLSYRSRAGGGSPARPAKRAANLLLEHFGTETVF
jgi:hypothetical protein